MPGIFREQELNEAWNQIIMYDEHTWGAYCSKSDPYDPFTVSQECYKKQFALDGHDLVTRMGTRLSSVLEQEGSASIDVFNTSSWMRNGLVFLSAVQSGKGDRVLDDRGEVLASQRLQTGELAFMARDVPPFGSRRFTIRKGKSGTPPDRGVKVDRAGISNEYLRVKIDPATGSVSGLESRLLGIDLVDDSRHQLNDYLYVEGRTTGKGMKEVPGLVRITVEEAGPLVGVLKIESSAPGCHLLSRRIRLVAGRPGMEIINAVDKQRELDPEGVYFAFPLNVPGGRIRMDIPWGMIRPEIDQLPGANRNYFSIQRWMDISNRDYGITWITADAPMVKFSPMELVGRGRGDSEHMAEFHKMGIRSWWKENADPGSSFYSWTMNNHWEVNYKAFQEGPASFRYYLLPHQGSYEGGKAERSAREYFQPLIPLETDPSLSSSVLPFEFSSDQLIVTSLKSGKDGGFYLLRIYNPAENPGSGTLRSRSNHALGIRPSGSGEGTTGEAIEVELPGFGVSSMEIFLSGKH